MVVTPGLDMTDPEPVNRKDMKVLALGLTDASQGFPALPYVADEVQDIHQMLGGHVLLNKNFELPEVRQMLNDHVFSMVHIASHGHFDSDKSSSFILTFDNKLTLQQLDQCLGIFRFRSMPLDLLTLSACETAAGDDRAALGMAGIAVKAGARCALASLWTINDRASAMLVVEFYRQLLNPSASRAQALQSAQVKLLNDPRYHHPVFWSPFLLINNWL